MRRIGGAVAGGNPLVVSAGLSALQAGGNAVDAMIAAKLMAGVVEIGLTGLGGAGMALVKQGGEVWSVDGFSVVPGLGVQGREPEMEKVTLDFRGALQSFHVGPGSVSVPSLPATLGALYERWGSIPLERLVRPAVQAAREGFPLVEFHQRSLELLWSILSRDPMLRERLTQDGQRRSVGDRVRFPELADTLELIGREGFEVMYTGAPAQAMLDHLGESTSLSAEDLRRYRPRIEPGRHTPYRDAWVWTVGSPSQGALSLRAQLQLLGQRTLDEGPLSFETAQAMLDAQTAVLRQRQEPGFLQHFFEEDFEGGFLADCQAGFTTHISTVDGAGGAVSLTSSLGESCGIMVPETGVLLNNLLGEDDVNPPSAPRAPGERMMTMCSPCMIEQPGRLDVLGSGGSSRIPTVMMHGVVYRVDYQLDPQATVAAPRIHQGDSDLRVEGQGRPPGVLARMREAHPHIAALAADNLFFGGLHLVSLGADGLSGAGDPRRGGCVGMVPSASG